MDRLFHPTHYWSYDYLAMLGLKLNHIGKRGHWYVLITSTVVVTGGHWSRGARPSVTTVLTHLARPWEIRPCYQIKTRLVIFNLTSRIDISVVKFSVLLSSGDDHTTALMIGQHWFRQLLGAVGTNKKITSDGCWQSVAFFIIGWPPFSRR